MVSLCYSSFDASHPTYTINSTRQVPYLYYQYISTTDQSTAGDSSYQFHHHVRYRTYTQMVHSLRNQFRE